ncbi:MAG: hypothetical protein WBI57_17090 [Desulfobacterales bacterium]
MSDKVNFLVGYIRSNDIFDLDVMDLRFMNGHDVLRHFGISELLSEWEEALFMMEMGCLAQRYQTLKILKSLPES